METAMECNVSVTEPEMLKTNSQTEIVLELKIKTKYIYIKKRKKYTNVKRKVKKILENKQTFHNFVADFHFKQQTEK